MKPSIRICRFTLIMIIETVDVPPAPAPIVTPPPADEPEADPVTLEAELPDTVRCRKAPPITRRGLGDHVVVEVR